MWIQEYRPVANSLALSALAAAVPLLVLGVALGIFRIASWKASILALITAFVIAIGVFRMPATLAIAAAAYGAAFGLFPLGLIVYAAILLFDIAVESGRFDRIRQSLSAISGDQRIQALIIAFAFGAFLEGAAGAGTPVAVSASLLVGIGFAPLMAGGISLLANTAPVAFGALGLPIVTLAAVTGLPLQTLSTAVGRICPLIALIVPAYLVVVLAGARGALAVWPALLACGAAFGVAQFLVSNFVGPYLADIMSALAGIGALVVLLRHWRPADAPVAVAPAGVVTPSIGALQLAEPDIGWDWRRVLDSWSPYLLLVATVIIWGATPTQRLLDRATLRIPVPLLHNVVVRTTPVVSNSSTYPAVFIFNWLSAAGTACLVSALLAAGVCGLGARETLRLARRTARRLAFAELTIAVVLALAFVMNYAGATATLGLSFAATGPLFPFFGAYLGWLGVFLTGSDTSANALFGPLQVVSAQRIHLNPVLMAAINTCGGVTGKMISIQSIAVAAAATGLRASDEATLFRFTLKHSILLAAVVGLIASVYAYLWPSLIPSQ